jgi:hypothetical protein
MSNPARAIASLSGIGAYGAARQKFPPRKFEENCANASRFQPMKSRESLYQIPVMKKTPHLVLGFSQPGEALRIARQEAMFRAKSIEDLNEAGAPAPRSGGSITSTAKSRRGLGFGLGIGIASGIPIVLATWMGVQLRSGRPSNAFSTANPTATPIPIPVWQPTLPWPRRIDIRS